MQAVKLSIQGFKVRVSKVDSGIQVERLPKEIPLDIVHSVEREAANQAEFLFGLPEEQVTDGL